jgi:malonyl CoA-acyl carrier protein transacylase
MSIAFLFPGQGSLFPGMLQMLPDHPVIARTLDEISEILGTNSRELTPQKRCSLPFQFSWRCWPRALRWRAPSMRKESSRGQLQPCRPELIPPQ